MGDIGEAFDVEVDIIEVHLEKTILMIKRQKNVIPTLMLEEKNTNEDIEPHAQIDGSDILNFIYNLLPKVGVFFLVNCFVAIPLLIIFLKPHLCPTFLLHMKRWVGHFFG